MNMTLIAAELFAAGVLPSGELVMDKLQGGTASEVYVLECGDSGRLVCKINKPDVIAAEVRFLQMYERLPIVPSLRYVDRSSRYYLYPYIEGSTRYRPGKKGAVLLSVARQLIAKYREAEWEGTHYKTWQRYLAAEVEGTRREAGDLLTDEDHSFIAELVAKPRRVTGPFYQLHGDCGIHNFIFDDEGELAAVIDPIPIIGQPLYDLAFAYCSTPDGLTPDVIAEVVYHEDWPFTRDLTTLYEEVAIALYNRIVICTYHHPQDLNAYLAAWTHWKMIVGAQR
ncbi:aminoglycoside phosphotransferase family protein [Paenibacillus sp. GCM10027626]|uniref:aminoglycoside phosphotransferase family protein n=1 Tax=Paenibacillus sp. GCM10027626 TaxID=3273411 RepID=UPI0036332A6F